MKILVVEDDALNIEAAKRQLVGHDVTILTGYDQAHNALLEKAFDWLAIKEAVEPLLPAGWSFLVEERLKQVSFISENKKIRCSNYCDCLPESFHVAHAEYIRAKEKTASAPFDVVLTDVMLPKGGYQCMSEKGEELVDQQGNMPYGPIIALRALQMGVKKVGILTSGGHHHDPFVFAFDFLDGFAVGDVKVVCSNKMDTYVDNAFIPTEFDSKLWSLRKIFSVKNWRKLLEELS